MSVLIKGMEMPEECEVCPMRHFYIDTGKTVCMLTHTILADNYDIGIAFNRHDVDCPLVELPEKHGKEVEFTKVIRCRDCKHREWDVIDVPYGHTKRIEWCSIRYNADGENVETTPNDFCSKAERKEE